MMDSYCGYPGGRPAWRFHVPTKAAVVSMVAPTIRGRRESA